jgi:hypothetical protein
MKGRVYHFKMVPTGSVRNDVLFNDILSSVPTARIKLCHVICQYLEGHASEALFIMQCYRAELRND